MRFFVFVLFTLTSLLQAGAIVITGNGQSMTVNPGTTYHIRGTFSSILNYGSLIIADSVHVTGNYIQGGAPTTAANLDINTAAMQVDGSAGFNGALDDNTLSLNIDNGGELNVGGNFTINGSNTSPISGSIDVKGDYTVGISGQTTYNTGSLVTLSGISGQTVTLNYSESPFQDLTITNNSTGGITFADGMTVEGNLTYESCSKLTNLEYVQVNGSIITTECTRPYTVNLAPVIVYLLN